jgi:putative restriction endonuclease
MTDLFLVPVSDNWIDDYERTVASPLALDDPPVELAERSEVRVWGTSVGDEGSKKRTTFETMDSGDCVLFMHEGVFVGSARVSETFESRELGAWIWDEPESAFVYTLTDYKEISLPRGELWDVLDYSANYPLYGFSRASDDALSSLLQTYNSVEEAFQAFRGEAEGGEETASEPDPDGGAADDGGTEDGDDTREHTEIQ